MVLMAEVAQIWQEIAPKVKEGVTGVGVWTAINSCVPVALEDGSFVLGVPDGATELGGHLRMAATARLIEQLASSTSGQQLRLRVIDGTTAEDWERAKRRDQERRRLQEAEMTKMRAELESKTSWDSVYETLSRRYAAVPNRSMPQNRARFFDEAVSIVAEARSAQSEYDDLAERNFARCIERVAQYAEVPSTLVALEVLKRCNEI